MWNINENTIRVTEYDVLGELPDPFLFDDGGRVRTKEDWEKRRAEIYKTAVELQYGEIPPEPEVLKVETAYAGGKGGANSYRITAGTRGKTLTFMMKLFLPKTGDKFPVIVSGDMCFNYCFNEEYRAAMLDNGIAFAVFDRTSLADDKRTDPTHTGPIFDVYPDLDFGSVAAWAWGYSRCVDALLTTGLIDENCIVFTGHSRGAKTAMLAGVLDKRAAIVNPNETNAGSCACYRIHMKAECEDGVVRRSEQLSDLAVNYPGWIGSGMQEYKDRENDLPFDCHFLKALVAPRVLFVSEAASDLWGNPIGSWETSGAAKEVYKFLGAEDNICWYFRNGFHYHKPEDILQLVNVIKHFRGEEELNDKYFKQPFKEPELIFDWKCPEK